MDVDTENLTRRLAECPIPGSIWRHYKGGMYRVVARAVQESTLLPLVVYQSMADAVTWARPLHEWQEPVNVAGDWTPRFRSVDS